MNRISPLSVAIGLGLAGFIATAPTSADVPRYQMLTLSYSAVTYTVGFNGGTPYPQSFTLTLNPCDGTFGGPGYQPALGVTTQTEGSIEGVLISYMTNYTVGLQTDYSVIVDDAVLSPNYSFSGFWSDNYSGGPQSGVVVSDIPIVTSTAYRNHGDFVSQSADKDDAAHSCIGMPIVSNK